MRKTRVLAALLCLMMIVTAIPMIQATAATTTTGYTLEQVLQGAAQTNFTDCYTVVTSNYTDEDGTYTGTANSEIYSWLGAPAQIRFAERVGGATIAAGTAANLYTATVVNGDYVQPITYRDDLGYVIEKADGTAGDLTTNGNANYPPTARFYGDVAAEENADTLGGLFLTGGTHRHGGGGMNHTNMGQSGTKTGGWEWNQSNMISGKQDLDMGVAGALKFTLKLVKDGSAAKFTLKDGKNGDSTIGFQVSNAGIQMVNANTFSYGEGTIATVTDADLTSDAAFPLTTGTWYDIIIKNNYNRYTVYAKAMNDTNYTKVVSGNPTGYNANATGTDKFLRLESMLNTSGAIKTDLITLSDGTQQRRKDGDYAVGDTVSEGVTVTTVADSYDLYEESVVQVNSITTYSDTTAVGQSLTEILGTNTSIGRDMVFDADMKAVFDNGKQLEEGVYTSTGAATADGYQVKYTYDESAGTASNSQLQIAWPLKGNGTSYGALSGDAALEYTLTLDANASMGSLNMKAGILDQNYRYYLDFYPNGLVTQNDGQFAIQNVRLKAGNEITILAAYDATNNIISNYVKLDNGKYMFIGSRAPRSGGEGGAISATSGIQWKASWTADDYKAAVANHKVSRVTRYVTSDTLVADAAAKPAGTLRTYVDEDFADVSDLTYDIQQSKYSEEASVPGVTIADGVVKMPKPSYGDTSNKSGTISTNLLVISKTGVPLGGYAEMRLKVWERIGLTVDTGVTRYNTEFSLCHPCMGILSTKFNADPSDWVNLRIVRSTEDKWSVYAKHDGADVWFPIATNASGSANATAGRIVITAASTTWHQWKNAAQYVDVVPDDSKDACYIDSVKIYGPAAEGSHMTVLDGAQTTTVLTSAGNETNTLTNGTAKVVVTKGESTKQLVFAGYKGSKMVVAAPVTVPAGEGDESVLVPSSVSSADTDYVRVFLWDSFDVMTPLDDSVTYR